MLRDLILETLLERQLTTYSRAIADWLAIRSGERAGEYDALIAGYYEQAGDLIQAAEYYRRAGNAAVTRAALDESARLFEKGLALLDRETQPAEYMQMQLVLGNLYSWIGVYDKAQEQITPALAAARAMGDQLSEANALAQLGRIAGIWLGDYEKGQAELEEALGIARQLDDTPTLIFILRQLGNQSTVTAAHDQAALFLEESLTLARETDDLNQTANALNSLGENARHQGDYDRALAYYLDVLVVLDEQDSPNIRAMVNTNLGFVYVEQGNFAAARQAGEEALSVTREIGTEYLISGCLQILAGAAVGLGDDGAGRQYLVEALQTFREMGNLPELLATLPDCARLRARSGNIFGALEWLGMVFAHPSLSAFGRLRAERALDELKSNLPEAEVEAALAQGAELTLGAMLDQFLNQQDGSEKD
jgi:tetratricopeptide (TPR) repeat protein